MNWYWVRIVDFFIGVPMIFLVKILNFFRRLVPCSDNKIKKILVIKFWGIGNLLMMMPSAQAIKAKFPEADVEILTLVTNKSFIDMFNVFDKAYYISTDSILGFIKTCFRAFLCMKRKDVVIDFEQFARFSAIWALLVFPKRSIGFDTKGQCRRTAYTEPVTYDNNKHSSKMFFSLLEPLGISGESFKIDNTIEYTDQEIIDMDPKISEYKGKYIVFHVGTSANFRLRRWPLKYFEITAKALLKKHDIYIFLTGVKSEQRIIDNLRRRIGQDDRVLPFYQSSLKEFFYIVKQSKLVLSCDTSPVHVASFLGTPVVGLYGPNVPSLYGPWGDGKGYAFYNKQQCSPCITNYNAKYHKCKHPQGKGFCMRQIQPQEVITKIDQMLGGTQ